MVVGVGYWLLSPLFIDKQAEEVLDADTEAAIETAIQQFRQEKSDTNLDDQLGEEEQEEMFREMAKAEDRLVDDPMPAEMNDLPLKSKEEVMSDESSPQAIVPPVMEDPSEKEAMPVETESTKAPSDEPSVKAVGQFVTVAHRGEGVAKLIYLGDNKGYVIRFEDFEVENGPDLRVLLSKNTNIRSANDLGETLELGQLKGNIGTQNYSIASDVNVDDYKTVIIYCKPFRVVFNTAELQ